MYKHHKTLTKIDFGGARNEEFIIYTKKYIMAFSGESIPIRLFLSGYELTPSMRDINKKFSVRYYLNLVLVDEEERRYFKQQVSLQCYLKLASFT